jgi:ketosteroid isomerase-like protein
MRTLAAFAVLFLVAACQAPPAEMTEAERAQYEAEVIQAIESRIDAFYEALLQGDAQTATSFWTSDALVLMPGLRVSGSEVPTFLAELLETTTFTAYDFEILEWFIHGDVAYYICSYDETLRVEGQEVMVRNYDFARWEKEDGVWMIDRLFAGPRDAPPEG